MQSIHAHSFWKELGSVIPCTCADDTFHYISIVNHWMGALNKNKRNIYKHILAKLNPAVLFCSLVQLGTCWCRFPFYYWIITIWQSTYEVRCHAESCVPFKTQTLDSWIHDFKVNGAPCQLQFPWKWYAKLGVNHTQIGCTLPETNIAAENGWLED